MMEPQTLTLSLGRFQVTRDRLTDTTYQFQPQQTDDAGQRSPITWQQAIVLWQQSKEFRALFTQALSQVPLPAFFWETPPITPSSLHAPWEWVTVSAPSLAQVEPDPRPFNRYLNAARQEMVTTFPNLGGDALLVVPCQQGEFQTYAHLASFLRAAPTDQIHRLWQILGQTVQQHLVGRGDRPLWVSTSGLGVYWLHIRLDDRPKYYTYRPYR
ncbi:MAG: hypothetical protein AAGH78_07040 [Cyanobacteria bacterium P01_H01_bin.58]